MEAKPRLGRGLSALLGETPGGSDGATEVTLQPASFVPIAAIEHNPFQPRKSFDDEELLHLSDSIKNHGILQPLVVRRVGEGYQLIAGERRLRASQLAGLTEVPVRVVEFDDQQVLEAALVENIQRSDLNAIEKAQGFKDYLDRYQVTQEQLAARLGMDRSSVSNLVNLLHLPKEVQDAVRLEQITLGHAKILKGLGDAGQQIALCKEVMMKGLSVKALEMLVKQQKAEANSKESAVEEPRERSSGGGGSEAKTPHVQSIEDELRQRLAVKLEIRVKGKDKGQIIIGFESNDDFERVIEALRR